MADVLARGLKMHVQRLGPAHAHASVVLLHGLVMDNLSSLYFTLGNALAATCDVILYDLRGHGLSSRPATGYTLSEMVLDLAALLDALELSRPVYLVGNSFGGLLALAFAAAYPERARGVVLVDGHVGQTGWAEQMSATLSLTGEERDKQIATSFQSWLGRSSEKKSTRLARTASALVYGTSLVADMRSSGALPPKAMRNIEAPVLGLYGETSDLLPAAREAKGLIPGFDLRVFEGCSHSVLWEATARVRDTISAWIEDRRSAPPSRSYGSDRAPSIE